MSVSLEILTDDDILDYSRTDGKDKVLYDHRDLNLQSDKRLDPYPGGVYDVEAFGSPFEDRCLCKHTRRKEGAPSTGPCPSCGARVFSREDALRRFARIELPFFYLNDLRFDVFKKLFDDIFSESTINLDFRNGDIRIGGFSAQKGGKKLGIKVFDTCQFDYNPLKKELTISEFIDDLDKCSYEGILKIIQEHFPTRADEFRKLINKYYLVLPEVMRPFSLMRTNSGKKHVSHPMSRWYSAVIRFCCVEDVTSNSMNYKSTIELFSTPGEKSRYNAILRAFLNAGKKEATALLNSSKENFARDLFSVRTKNSARCAIIPSTDLAIDEVGIPVSVAYEMCREGFIKHLINDLNFTEDQALEVTKVEYDNPKTQELFKEYAEKQIVLF